MQKTFMLAGATNMTDMYEKYYTSDDLFWGIPKDNDPDYKAEKAQGMNVLKMPPIKKMICIHGKNVKTEVCFFFKKDKKNGGLCLDSAANFEIGGINVRNGIGWETKDTDQNPFGKRGCGDGTVPYMSLNYPAYWRDDNPQAKIDIHEIEGAEHRSILQNKNLFSLLDGILKR